MFWIGPVYRKEGGRPQAYITRWIPSTSPNLTLSSLFASVLIDWLEKLGAFLYDSATSVLIISAINMLMSIYITTWVCALTTPAFANRLLADSAVGRFLWFAGSDSFIHSRCEFPHLFSTEENKIKGFKSGAESLEIYWYLSLICSLTCS